METPEGTPEKTPEPIIQEDPWAGLKAFTPARIALGAAGVAIPLREVLRMRLAHAHAKDAVYSALSSAAMAEGLGHFNAPIYVLRSRAQSRSEYLQQPYFGRRLDDVSVAALEGRPKADLAIVIADGLSASGMNRHALPVLESLVPLLRSIGLEVCFATVEQGRVAIGDEIGGLLNARLVAVMIGERPGLSSPDSMGVYITFAPKLGLTDESRNCISNIRPEGLGYEEAANKMYQLITESLRLGLSGVGLKDVEGLL